MLFAAALVAWPLGSNTLGAQAPPLAPRPTLDTLMVVPDSAVRDSTEVRAVGRRYAGTIRNCYQEQGLKSDPTLRGLVRIELTVLPTGVVQAAAATAEDVSGTGMPAVTACVSTATRTWRFSNEAPRTERVVLEFDLLPPSP